MVIFFHDMNLSIFSDSSEKNDLKGDCQVGSLLPSIINRTLLLWGMNQEKLDPSISQLGRFLGGPHAIFLPEVNDWHDPQRFFLSTPNH
jgi:hypothetical protein